MNLLRNSYDSSSIKIGDKSTELYASANSFLEHSFEMELADIICFIWDNVPFNLLK